MTPIAFLGRGGAGILLAAALGTSWWFVVYALEDLRRVSAGNDEGATLLPIAVGAGALALIGATIDRIAPWTAGPVGVLGARSSRTAWWGFPPHGPVAPVVYFAVPRTRSGRPLLSATQLRAILARTASNYLPLVALAVPGAVLAVALAVAASHPATPRRRY